MSAYPPLHREQTTEQQGELSVVETPEYLPFVGREHELDYLTAFARGALSADRLSALWLQGEAGIGKSRLIDRIGIDLFPAVVLIRVSLYPDSNFSLHSALASAIIEAAQIYGISTSLSLPTSLPATLAELRGIIRRYPTLIVFEDVHLVDHGSISEFAAILHGLERESVGFVCTSRPSSGPAYGVVLPSLVTTLSLSALDIHSIHALAQRFGYDPERYPNLIQLVMERTHGSPLAIWSIFRRIQSDPRELIEHPLRTVREIAAEISSSILESMAHGLSDEELLAAEHLALLGEVFSSRSAAVLLDNWKDIIPRLQATGIISPQSGSPVPLVGVVSIDPPDQDWLYRFSHSLLHEALVKRSPEANERLLMLLESDIPIYSTLPFTHAAERGELVTTSENLNRLLIRYRRVISELASSPAWSAGVRVFRAIESLLMRQRDLLQPQEHLTHLTEMLLLECELYNAFSTRPEFQRPLAKVMEMTSEPESLEEAIRRVRALQFSLFRSQASWQVRGEEALREIRELLEKFPDLISHEETRSLFANLAGSVRSGGRGEEVEYIREIIDQMLEEARQRGDRRTERAVLREVAPQIIPLFRNREEIEDRRRLAREIIDSFGQENPSGRILTTWVRFLENTGEADQAHLALHRWMPPVLSGYNIGTEVGLRLQKLNVDAALGLPLEQIGRRAKGLITEFSYIQPAARGDSTPSFAQIATATHLITIGAMRGNVRQGYRLAVEICGGDESAIRGYRELDRAVLTGDMDLLRQLAAEKGSSKNFAAMISWIRSGSEETERDARTELREVLKEPILRRHDLLTRRVAIGFYDLYGGEWGGLSDEEREGIEKSFRAGLEWLGERYAPGYAEVFAHSAGEYLDVGEIGQLLGERYATLPQATVDSHSSRLTLLKTKKDDAPELEISLLGKITTRMRGEKPKGVRGARMKRLIAMLGVQEMLSADLSLQQFRDSATELDDPEESANYLRILTSRLRKSIGNRMVLTDGEHPPRFNTDLVRLDVVELTDSIRTAIRAAGQSNGAAACRLLDEVLETIDGQKILPEQEGEIFEAARREFDDLLREAVHRTVDLLRREGSAKSAEELNEKFKNSRL